ncbi:2-polyprenyl-3-methyl-5-hydroxy-6-metoxy-1,4-benzoquinol methylase/predicted RNA-binding Zn-ribbon protein involved in translation (DUF1610 family) [Marmoricola sp. OAE513]|uniref:class I SAM-dependent methyltransferase n=1 Tax=Marmoricola sp. OAE513 TaxID=2817894 RepID=UPI001AE6D62B
MAAATQSAESTILRCPGCGSARLLHYPASRKTGRSVLGCRACGLRSWAERREFSTPVYSIEVETEERDLGEEYSGYADQKRIETVEAAWTDTAKRLLALSAGNGSAQPRLYDVGTGDGAFLKLAENTGFTVAGNEVHAGAARLAKARYGYDVEIGDLSELELEPIHDALTMWCVMVHTEDVDMTLDNCNKLLKPGGTLFLQTPHWTAADALALGALRATRGRLNRIVDRRVAWHHWQLHTRKSIKVLLDRHGFDTFEVRPRGRYSLNSALYMQSLGVPAGVAERSSKLVDLAIKYGPVPRIVLDVYATKR